MNCLTCGDPFTVDPWEYDRGGGRFCSRDCWKSRPSYAVDRLSLIAKFWQAVKIGEQDDCWIWLKSLNSNGAAQFRWQGQVRPAARAAWEISNGPIIGNLEVCHTCDDRYPVGDTTYRQCVNPSHLWLGTHAQNMKDCSEKLRGTRWKAKLSDAEAKEIVQRYGSGNESQEDLAKAYGVGQSVISRLVAKNSYRWTTHSKSGSGHCSIVRHTGSSVGQSGPNVASRRPLASAPKSLMVALPVHSNRN